MFEVERDAGMISVLDSKEFLPYGRQFMSLHPGSLPKTTKGLGDITDHGLPIVKALRDFTLNSEAKLNSWHLRKSPESEEACEEELYIDGNTVVWSRGSLDGAGQIIKSFTMDSHVQEALWCNFLLPVDEIPLEAVDPGEILAEKQTGVAIIESNNVNVFTTEGKDYITAIPFKLSRTWRIQGGLLFERCSSDQSSSSTPQRGGSKKIPVLFSMMHPLDDIAPVIYRTGGNTGATKVSYVSESSHQIVYTHENPSLVMTYDRALSAHSIWTIRRAKPEEVFSVCNPGGDVIDVEAIGNVTPGFASKSTSVHLSSRLTTSSQSPSLASPFRSLASRSNTPSHIHSKLQSPSLSQMHALSRTQSPQTPTGHSTLGVTAEGRLGVASRLQFSSPVAGASSLSGAKASPAAGRTPLSFSYNASSSGNAGSSYDTSIRPQEGLEPLPELCLDHVWTETATCRDGLAGVAKKVFLTTDRCGQRYICFLVPFRNQLKLVKYDEINDGSQLILGTTTALSVRDAVGLPALNMVLVLDMANALVLYSGLIKINQVHMWSLPSPLSTMGTVGGSNLAQRPSIDVMKDTSMRFPHLLMAEGGGPVTSSRPSSRNDARFDMDDDVALLSPVPTEMNDSSSLVADTSLTEELSFQQPRPPATLITALRDPVDNRFTVELTNGSLYRASLALDSGNPLIKLSLEALKQILPRDSSFQMLTRWYSTYNAPGSINGQSEWTRFSKCLLGMMGYDITKLQLTTKRYSDNSTPNTPKKSRPSDQGSSEDWNFLIGSDHHDLFERCQGYLLHLGQGHEGEGEGITEPIVSVSVDNSAPLFQHVPSILWALHLVYEEFKLNSLVCEDLEPLAQILQQLAIDLNCPLYVDLYARDWPRLFANSQKQGAISQEFLKQMTKPSFFSVHPPKIQDWIYRFLNNLKPEPYPYLRNVNELTKYSVALLAVMFARSLTSITWSDYLRKVTRAGQRSPDFEDTITRHLNNIPLDSNMFQRVVLFASNLGRIFDDVTGGISLIIKEAINYCRESPPTGWPHDAYTLIGREDLAEQKKKAGSRGLLTSVLQKAHTNPPSFALTIKGGPTKEDDDGMERLENQLIKLRFPEDLRINEIRRLLQSSKPARVHVVQRPEVSDHEHIENLERALYAICIRTMALGTGRGMFTLSTCQPLPTETLPIPRLCLTGRAPPRNTTVDLTHIDTPTNMNHWPLFHNGVAAGLRVAPSAKVDSTWILYNKPRNSDLTNEHAGFLMGLGLNGLLNGLATLNVHDYLCRGHEMTSVGLILGIAAGKRGTMDMTTTKLLSIHVAALLPPTSTELDVPHSVQVAAILGVGLVYQGTAHRHIAQVLLGEIDRPPGPEMENCCDRESYSLAAGLGLGMVMLGKGHLTTGLSDLNMADQLYHYMVGGYKRPHSGAHKERYRTSSYQIKEGDCVNTDVTAPGSTLALGMMFFNTNSSAVAEWLAAPDTQFLLDFVRPDLLMLRTVSRSLVLWNEVHPSAEWVNSNLPEIVSKYAFNKQEYIHDPECDIDFETMSQAYCNIIAGACMALGLKFAGSANIQAFDCLRAMADQMLRLMNKSLVEQAGKSSVESCLVVIVLALAMVMSGTGNLEVLRLCRHLRSRVGGWFTHVLYGSHMAVSMAIGLLFLGGGRYTLSTEPQAIAAMLCAFFPKFPIHTNDNRYHLQALRHLYVLAAEPRVLVPRDVQTGKLCYVPLEITFKASGDYEECSYDAMAPCLLPELSLLKEIRIKGPRYWPVSFNVSSNWQVLKDVLAGSGYLHVKQRVGHLSYQNDPQGYHSVLSQSLTTEPALGRVIRKDDIQSFSSDSTLLTFAEYFCSYSTSQEFGMIQFLSKVLYECVSQEKLQAIPVYMAIQQLNQVLPHRSRSLQLQELCVIMTVYKRMPQGPAISNSTNKHTLISPEFFIQLRGAIDTHLASCLQKPEGRQSLKEYLSEMNVTNSNSFLFLASYLEWLSIPHPQLLLKYGVTETTTLVEMLQKLTKHGMTVPAIMALTELIQSLKT